MKWPDEMAMSKAIRVALRYVRVSVEFDIANRADETVLDLEEVLTYDNGQAAEELDQGDDDDVVEGTVEEES